MPVAVTLPWASFLFWGSVLHIHKVYPPKCRIQVGVWGLGIYRNGQGDVGGLCRDVYSMESSVGHAAQVLK